MFGLKSLFYSVWPFLFFDRGPSDPLAHVVVSVPYLADVIQHMTCSKAADLGFFQVEALMPSTQDPHTFTLSPRQRLKVAWASFVITIDPRLEFWLSSLKADVQQGAHPKFLTVTEEIFPQQAPGQDFHLWLSSDLTLKTVQVLAHGLDVHFPNFKRTFASCIENYKVKIVEKTKALKRFVSTQTSVTPPLFLLQGNDLKSFFKDFGFSVITLENLFALEEPRPKDLLGILRYLRSQKHTLPVTAVFPIVEGHHTVAPLLAQELDVPLGAPLYAEGLGPVGSGAEDTLGLWETNVRTILSAF